MDINFKDAEDVAKPIVSPDLINKLLTKLSNETMISTDTIVSIESQIGKGVIPNKIKNAVTSTASKHGYTALVSHMRSMTMAGNKSTMHDVLSKAYLACKSLAKTDINKLIPILQDDLVMLGKLYVPKSARTDVYQETPTVDKLRIGSVISDTIGATTFNDVNSITLSYLRRQTTCVPYGAMRILISIIKGDLIDYAESKVSTRVYNGTVGEFVLDNIRDMIIISKLNLIEGCSFIAANLDEYAISEPRCITMAADIIEEYNYIITNDSYVRDIAGRC